MTGKIIKGIAGFYYVNNGENKVYQCKAKGIFRNRKIKPLVGDDVEFSVLDEEAMEGNIDEILPRKNQLIRPAAANVDQALVLFALTHPAPNLNLLDRFLVMMSMEDNIYKQFILSYNMLQGMKFSHGKPKPLNKYKLMTSVMKYSRSHQLFCCYISERNCQ